MYVFRKVNVTFNPNELFDSAAFACRVSERLVRPDAVMKLLRKSKWIK